MRRAKQKEKSRLIREDEETEKKAEKAENLRILAITRPKKEAYEKFKVDLAKAERYL
jgi:hypothetical protein